MTKEISKIRGWLYGSINKTFGGWTPLVPSKNLDYSYTHTLEIYSSSLFDKIFKQTEIIMSVAFILPIIAIVAAEATSLMQLSDCSKKCRLSYNTCKSSAQLFSDMYQCYLEEEDCNQECKVLDQLKTLFNNGGSNGKVTAKKTGSISKWKKKRKHLLRKLTDCKMRNDELSLRVKELEEKLKKKN